MGLKVEHKKRRDMPTLGTASEFANSSLVMSAEELLARLLAKAPLGIIQKMAKKGDPGAQLRLGSVYSGSYDEGNDPKIIERDYVKAASWFLKAAEQGNAKAQFHLSMAYSLGHGVEKNQMKSQMWHNLAAANDPNYIPVRESNAFRSEYFTAEQIVKTQSMAEKWALKHPGAKTNLRGLVKLTLEEARAKIEEGKLLNTPL